MTFSIRKCASDIDGKQTRGFVIEIEIFGFLAELAFTR